MRTRLICSAAAAVAALAASTAGTAVAAPSTYVCTGTLASAVYDRILVPGGATCDGTNAKIFANDILIGNGATFILGYEGGPRTGRINRGVFAVGAASVQLHLADVRGSVFVLGGNGFFSTVEDNLITGDVVINGYSGFWLGFIRNNVGGSVVLSNNVMDDPDANEYVTNGIFGNLVCFGNSPAPHVGDSEGSLNKVGGLRLGQCASA